MPDSETGARLSIAAEWLRDQIALATNQQQGKSGELNVLLSADGMRGWKSPVQERQSPASGEQPSVLDALKEAIQSVKEHKKRFGELLERRENSNRLQDRYRKSLEVLDNYLHKIRFKDEILEQLIQTFLDFVRRGKDTFDFPFEIDEQSDGRLTIRSQYLEGPIQTGGGETQVLGILEMLAIARQFGLPVFLDEIGSYLHLDNLRKILEFLIEHTEVQAVLTTADEGFLQHLEEWGIPHRGYVVTKNPEGFTQLRPHKSRAPATS